MLCNVSRLVQGRLVLAAGIMVALTATLHPAPLRAADATVDLPAGGLILAPNAGLSLDEETLTIGAQSIKVRYVLANRSTADRTVLISFPLPDIPMADTRDQEFALPNSDPFNFVDFKSTVDGAPVTAEVEQRAVSTGLDVTQTLTETGIPLNPVTEGMDGLLASLPADIKSDLQERGIVDYEGDAPMPLWTLKTTFFWRQKVPAGKTVSVQHSYLPVVGTSKPNADAVEAAKGSFCLDPAAAERLNASSGGFSWVTYLLTAGAASFGPVGKFRLQIDRGTPDAVVATCRSDLKPAGASALEWVATNFLPEEDLRILFAK